MIEIQQDDAQGIVELRMTAPVSDRDYKETLIPAIDRIIAAGERVRVLAIVEAGLPDFTLGAIFQDARTGIKHWRGFDRAAVVTDQGALRKAVGAFSVFLPCPVSTFTMAELEDARRWLRESLGTIHQQDMGDGLLHVSLMGKLDSAAYQNDLEDLNAFMARHDKVRLLIDLREFDGWQGLGALGDHLQLVRGHAHKVERAAVVGDAGWQAMAAQVGKRAFGVEARYFDATQIETATAWLRG